MTKEAMKAFAGQEFVCVFSVYGIPSIRLDAESHMVVTFLVGHHKSQVINWTNASLAGHLIDLLFQLNHSQLPAHSQAVESLKVPHAFFQFLSCLFPLGDVANGYDNVSVSFQIHGHGTELKP